MNSRCPFLNQPRYCYAAAEISSDEHHINIKFHQEPNISSGAEVIQFLLKPIGLDQIDCEYTLSAVTPSIIY